MSGEPEILSVNVGEEVKMKDAFGQVDSQMKMMKGIGGTLHLTRRDDVLKVGTAAYNLSEQMKLPVVIVVRAMG
jgi:hypothetical protein